MPISHVCSQGYSWRSGLPGALPGVLVTAAALALASPAAAALAPEDSCRLSAQLKVWQKPAAASPSSTLEAGALLRVVNLERGWYEVQGETGAGFARAKRLNKVCSLVSPEELAPAPAPPPPSPEAELSRALSEAAKTKGADEARYAIAVMNLGGSDSVPPELRQALGGTISQTLADLGPFRAISMDEIAGMLELEETKQKLGCDDMGCLAEIGGALGVDYTISGRVIQTGESYLIQLTLTDIKQARVTERASRDYQGGLKGLLDEMGMATRVLVRGLLAEASGSLALAVSEEGATIKIDDSIVGVSPLSELAVAGGLHTVEIEKLGFVRYAKDVQISAGQATLLEVRLLPSEEFKREYQERAGLWRFISYGVGGAGLLALAGAGGIYGYRYMAAGELDAKITDYNAQTVRTDADEQDLRDDVARIATFDLLTVGTGAVGLALIGAGALVFLLGDDPGRYDTED